MDGEMGVGERGAEEVERWMWVGLFFLQERLVRVGGEEEVTFS